MTGGASNLANFMSKVQSEREKTNNKLDSMVKKLDRLETQVVKDGGSTGKMVEYLSKKAAVLEKQVQDIDHEQKMSTSFKKKQM